MADRLFLQGILYALHNDKAWQLLPLELGFGSGQMCWRRLERWQQAEVFDQPHRILLAELNAAGELGWSLACVDGSHIRAKEGELTQVRRRSTGGRRPANTNLICDGRGTPFKVITNVANVNDGIPPVAGHPGRPRRRPDSLLGDKGHDSNPNRHELRKRRILPVISRKGTLDIEGAWVNSAMSWSSPSPCSTSSSASPSGGNAEPNSTTPSSHWPAASAAGDASRSTDHDRVTGI